MHANILQGTLDLMILRALATMGAAACDGIANRLQQVSADSLNLNQGTILSGAARLDARLPGKTENNREAKHYTITKARD